jgi:hypothetical protein
VAVYSYSCMQRTYTVCFYGVYTLAFAPTVFINKQRLPSQIDVVIQLITCDISSLSLGFVIAGYRRPFTDVCLQTSVCRHPLYVCSLCYIRIYIAAG